MRRRPALSAAHGGGGMHRRHRARVAEQARGNAWRAWFAGTDYGDHEAHAGVGSFWRVPEALSRPLDLWYRGR